MPTGKNRSATVPHPCKHGLSSKETGNENDRSPIWRQNSDRQGKKADMSRYRALVKPSTTISYSRGGDAVATERISLGGLARRVHAVTGAATED